MSENKSEIPKLFGTSGVRGEVGTELTFDKLWNVGRALLPVCLRALMR